MNPTNLSKSDNMMVVRFENLFLFEFFCFTPNFLFFVSIQVPDSTSFDNLLPPLPKLA